METDSSDAHEKHQPPSDHSRAGIASSKSARILSLDSTTSTSERLAVKAVRAARRVVPLALIVLSDLAALIASGETAIWLRHLVDPAHFPFEFNPLLLIYSALMLLSYAALGLYSLIAHSGPEELRRLVLTTTTFAIIMAIVTYASRGTLDIRVSMYFIVWGFALVGVPLGRAATRAMFAKRSWWGCKVVLLSPDMETACRLIETLKRQPRLGIKPVAVITLGSLKDGQPQNGITHLHGANAALAHIYERGINYAIVAMPLLNNPEGLALLRRYEKIFEHWMLVPYFPHGYSLWVAARDLDGTLALEVTQHLLRRHHQIAKRTTDMILTILLLVIAIPIGLLIAVVIKLDSPGPVLYRHERLGKDGKAIRILKFRSMRTGASARLEHYLEQHPGLRAEWNLKHKLSNDPRVTRVGRLLRKTSLDELPQLLNVLSGQMSLVGPRPIVGEEIPRYGDSFDLYKRVRPGITGLWQVTGRSNLGYQQRVTLDEYYVRNWSFWLDLYLLARTVRSIFYGDGAF